MNKLVYLGVVIVIVLVVAAVLLTSKTSLLHSPATTTLTTTVQATTASTSLSTLPTSISTIPTTTISANSTTLSGCAAEKNFTCSNFTYSYSPSNNTYIISALISQNTSTSWSGFGIGYAPNGTSVTDGVPNITFYTTNSSSSSNVGTNLNQSQFVTILLKGDVLNATTNGTLWACYATSGILYVGNGCLVQGGSPATYVPIAAINAS